MQLLRKYKKRNQTEESPPTIVMAPISSQVAPNTHSSKQKHVEVDPPLDTDNFPITRAFTFEDDDCDMNEMSKLLQEHSNNM